MSTRFMAWRGRKRLLAASGDLQTVLAAAGNNRDGRRALARLGFDTTPEALRRKTKGARNAKR